MRCSAPGSRAAAAALLAALGAALPALPAAAKERPALVLQLGHTDRVLDADLVRTAQGLRAVTASADGTVKIWDAADGVLLQTWPWPGPARARGLVLTRDGGAAIAWGDYGDPVRIDLASGQAAPVPEDARRAVTAACHDDGRRRLLVAREGGDVRLYALPDLRLVARPPVTLPSTVRTCAFDRAGGVVALGDARGAVTWLDASKGLEPLDRREVDALMIDGLDAAPKGPRWAVMGRKDTVVWDLAARKEVARWRTRGSEGFVRWARDGAALVEGAHGSRALRLLDPETGRVLREVPDDLVVPPGVLDTYRWLTGLRGEGREAVLLRRDDTWAEVWRPDVGQPVATLRGHPLFTTAAAFLEGDRHLAVGTGDGRVQVWSLASGARRPDAWTGHRAAVTALAFSADGAWAASGDADGTVLVRRRADGAVDRTVRVGTPVRRLDFLADARTLVIQGKGRLQLFRVDIGFEVEPPEGLGRPEVSAWAPDGRRVLVADGARVAAFADGASQPLFEAEARVVDLALDRAGEVVYAVLASGGVERRRARDGKRLGRLAAPGPVDRLAVSHGGDLVVGVGPDAALRFWRADEEDVRVSFLADARDEWVAWTDDGAFDASEGGAGYITYRVGRRVLPADRFREGRQVPGLLGLRLDREARAPALEGRAADFRPPPAVRIASPGPGETRADALLPVTVEVEDAGGGVSEVRLYHQGRLVGELASPLGGGGRVARVPFDVVLEPGRNRLEARAYSAGRAESRSAPVDVAHGADERPVRLRLLAVGIDAYRDPALRLRFARGDAAAFAETLQARGARLFKGGVEARVLLDDQATRQGVLDGLRWLVASTRPEDVAVIYLAGHGETVSGAYHFVPQDLVFTNLDALADGGLSQDVLQDHIRRIPARKVVVLLDTCHSGELATAFATRGIGEKKALSVLGQAAGIYLVAASTSQQLALEDRQLGHGVFTWALLQGLGGKADLDGDRSVSVRELVQFVETEVARVSEELFGREQFPVTHGTGRSFPLALVAP